MTVAEPVPVGRRDRDLPRARRCRRRACSWWATRRSPRALRRIGAELGLDDVAASAATASSRGRATSRSSSRRTAATSWARCARGLEAGAALRRPRGQPPGAATACSASCAATASPTSCSSGSTCPPGSTSARARPPRSRCRSSRRSSRSRARRERAPGDAAGHRRRPDLRDDRGRRGRARRRSSTRARRSTSAARAARPRSRRHEHAAVATDPFVTGLVLGAGGSKRLGRPKQLLALRRRHAARPRRRRRPRVRASTRRSWRSAARRTRCAASVDLAGADVVVNDAYGEGCSSSIAAALGAVDPRCEVLVLMLGDQPGVTADTVAALLAGRGDAPLAVCRYDDGPRPPDRVRARACSASWPTCTATRACGGCSTSAPTRWREVRSRARSRSTSTPPRTTRRSSTRGGRMSPPEVTGEAAGEVRRLVPDVETLAQRLGGVDYLVDEGLATSMFLSLRLPQPLLLEGEAGVGKTEAAQVAGGRARHAADPPAVLRGDRRGRGAVRVELPPPAAEHPAGRRRRREAAARRTCSAPTT